MQDGIIHIMSLPLSPRLSKGQWGTYGRKHSQLKHKNQIKGSTPSSEVLTMIEGVFYYTTVYKLMLQIRLFSV